MYIFNSPQEAMKSCLDTKTFSVAHIFNVEKTMDVPTHDCYEVYYSVTGKKQFVVDKKLYDFHPGDILFISTEESYQIIQTDKATDEYYVLYIHPQYLKQLSTSQTDLSLCFTLCKSSAGHKVTLSANENQQFLYLILKQSSITKGFGPEMIRQAHFLELIVFLNELYLYPIPSSERATTCGDNYKKCAEILTYINQNLGNDLSMDILSTRFSISVSYLSTLFKKETGTSLHKYISKQRIALAKQLLSEGRTVTEVYTSCGFGDYSNFLKAFKKAVGVSPKKFAQLSGATFHLPHETAAKREPPHNLMV